MKFFKILTLLACMSLSGVSMAKEDINIVWGFNPGSNMATTIRTMVDELNQKQDKYRFLFVNRQGAGGTVAANSVTASPNNTLVAMSSSFIIRPYFEKEQKTHNLDSFMPIVVQGNGAPLFLVSHKYTRFQDLVNRPNISIGVSGIGSISHLVANELVQLNPSIKIINYKSMVEALTAAAGGHVDGAIGSFFDIQGLVEAKKLNVLGYTGNKEVSGYEGLLLSKNGLPQSSGLTANFAIFASTAMDKEKFQELRILLEWANQRPKTLEGYARDQISPANLDLIQTRRWYDSQRRYWQDKTNSVTSKVESK